MHTEDKPITANQKACQSVSQLSSSVVFDRAGKPAGERDVDQSIVLVSRETRTVFTANFLKTPKLRKWSIDR